MRILVVEDEPVAATVLAKGLREHAYAVDVAGDGSSAFAHATVNDYDLMIVDVLLPGMIWGKVLRSPLPHARIVRIDTRAAERMPGVLSVLTAKDLPDLLIGRRVYDMPVLARDCVRFIGEKVAVVAAEDPNVAEEALAQIEVEYEELPAVFDAQEAMTPDAPLLHPHYRSYPHAPAKYFSDIPNVHSHVTWVLGDVAQGFSSATHVFEHTFTTHYVHQGYIEPHASVVAIESSLNPFAQSPMGAQGLMQVMTRVHAERFVEHGGDLAALDPIANMKVGSEILHELIRRGGSISTTSPPASIAFGKRMRTAPPGRGSIVEPWPHQAAKRSESVK